MLGKAGGGVLGKAGGGEMELGRSTVDAWRASRWEGGEEETPEVVTRDVR